MSVHGTARPAGGSPSLYAPSLRLRRREWSSYGVGHTARRTPGDTRGTVVGKKGRFKVLARKEATPAT